MIAMIGPSSQTIPVSESRWLVEIGTNGMMNYFLEHLL